MKKIIVAVDGPAGSGKSSVSKIAALNTGLRYIDSGAIYRSVTWYILDRDGEVDSNKDYTGIVLEIQYSQSFNDDGTTDSFCGNKNISNLIRDEQIVKNIGIVSDNVNIRNEINQLLRKWGEKESLIMDGRDIGTVVFPNAELKIYLDASPEERAKRRFKEYEEKGKNVDLIDIKNQIILRDNQDMSRAFGALKKAKDAVIIDTSNMTKDDVIKKIENLIKELKQVDNMGEAKFEEDVTMAELLDSVGDDSVSAGEIVTGEVVSSDDNFAFLNIGRKTEGRVPLAEFEGNIPKIGEKLEVLLKSNRLVDGMFALSKRAAEGIKKWDAFKEWYNEAPETVEGVVVDRKKGGAIIDFGVYTAFLPQTHFADIHVKEAQKTQEKFEFKILKIVDKKRSVFVSRKQLVDERRAASWETILNDYNEGDKINGKVVRIVDFGAFVDLGGFEALVHNNDISWRKIFNKEDYISVGSSYDFKILGINKEDKKISLGLKQLTEDPWSTMEKDYPVGSQVKGKVSTVTNFGIFVELKNSVEGLVPLSEISYNKQSIAAKNSYKEGDVVTAEVISLDTDQRKLALSIKNTLENPWDNIAKRIPVGTKMKSKIKKIMPFGIFVELEDAIDGMIHVSDLSWDDKVSVNDYKKGDTVEFIVLEINKSEQKVACGIKQLTKSPWEAVKEKFPPRSTVKGEVVKIAPFGMFVKLDPDVEGLVHISEVSRKKVENIVDLYSVGDNVDVVVQNVDVSKKRISLSIKMLEKIQEKEELDKIMSDNISKTVSIGEMIKLKTNENEGND